MYNANLAAAHAVQLQGKKWVAVVLVAPKCEVGWVYVNDAITVVNFGESIAHTVCINYRGCAVYARNTILLQTSEAALTSNV